MQTMYYTTHNFIRHTDNVVDLTEYRRRLERARQEQTLDFDVDCADEPVQPTAGAPRAAVFGGHLLEGFASLGIIVMTVVFTAQVLFG
ncbi:MAG: hypothetical protein E7450_07335 [Ruminococcaceae bacterium]|nr:hypothetical protein [Oscillospiraceae bacterium]